MIYILVSLIIGLFLGFIIFLEALKRKMVEEIRIQHHNLFLSYYTQKIIDLCGNDQECKNYLSERVLNELVNNIEKNKINYVDIYSAYEAYLKEKQKGETGVK